ncbi:hypothetical protein SANTM175S_05717 [Streptomyces antimycoticus]
MARFMFLDEAARSLWPEWRRSRRRGWHPYEPLRGGGVIPTIPG